jgi:hypothetical protein
MVAAHFDKLARHHLGDAERSRSRRSLGEFRPAASGFVPLRRADHQHGWDHLGEEAERRLRVDRNRPVVDLLITIEHIDE